MSTNVSVAQKKKNTKNVLKVKDKLIDCAQFRSMFIGSKCSVQWELW